MKQYPIMTLFSILALGLLAACSPQTLESGAGGAVAIETASADPTATAEEDLLLLWQGRPLGVGADSEACARLEIRTGGEATFGPCAGRLTTSALNAPQWEEMVARLAPVSWEGNDSQLRFQGQGQISGPAWEQALANWARTTYGELATGRVCAACRTALTWSFGPLSEEPQRCTVLWVTDYGYAQRGTVPCGGGQTEVAAQGWLETAEWQQLEDWLRTSAPLYLEDGTSSLLGQGTQEMGAAEQEALAAWAQAVATRLAPAEAALIVTATDEAPTAPPPVEEAALCPDVPRPAVVFFTQDQDYLITDVLSGASCETTLDSDSLGRFQATGDAIYYAVLENAQLVVKRLAQAGDASLLSFTAVEQVDALLHYGFVVSSDGSHIAWSAASAGPDYAAIPTSNMWVSSIEGGDVVAPLPELQSAQEDGLSQALVPVRFSEDNSTLYYTIQPIGLGGMWSSFVGRYQNLYTLRLNTEAEPTLIFDCAHHDASLCLGDFYEIQGQVSTLAYVDDKAVVIVNGQGDVLNTIALDDDYVGFPTFGPGGELVFYGADLSQGPDASILPEQGTLYRVAPPTASPEVLASAQGLLLPNAWLDAGHVVVGYSSGGENWGAAVVSLDGSLSILQSEPNASFAVVLPAPAE